MINPKAVQIAREDARLTQEELGIQVGVSQQAIQAIECGRSKRSAFFYDIARVLRVDPVLLTMRGVK